MKSIIALFLVLAPCATAMMLNNRRSDLNMGLGKAEACFQTLENLKTDLRNQGHDIPKDGEQPELWWQNLNKFNFREKIKKVNSHQSEGGASGSEFKGLYEIIANMTEKPKRICQVGFNYGTSAVAFLCGAPKDTEVVSFDMGGHPYVMPAHDWINKHDEFKGRHFIHLGDSTQMLPKAAEGNWLADKKCDVVFVDGGHSQEVAFLDIQNFRQLATPNAKVIVDDCSWQYQYYKPVLNAVDDAVKKGIITDMKEIQFPSYDIQHSRAVCKGNYVPPEH